MTGESTGISYTLGQPVQVRVVRVDIEQARIDLELVEDVAGADQGSSARRARGKRRARRR